MECHSTHTHTHTPSSPPDNSAGHTQKMCFMFMTKAEGVRAQRLLSDMWCHRGSSGQGSGLEEGSRGYHPGFGLTCCTA